MRAQTELQDETFILMGPNVLSAFPFPALELEWEANQLHVCNRQFLKIRSST